jgi:hypothetical protein
MRVKRGVHSESEIRLYHIAQRPALFECPVFGQFNNFFFYQSFEFYLHKLLHRSENQPGGQTFHQADSSIQIGIIKAIEVEAELAIPADVTIKLSQAENIAGDDFFLEFRACFISN